MRATHKGECQICGSVQMLPSGRLSKHGYTVKWGFFSGVCHGSGRLPFEQSTDAIQPAVDGVKATIIGVEAEIALLEDLNSAVNGSDKAWNHTYLDRAGYVWQQVPVVDFKENPLSTGSSYYSANIVVQRRQVERREPIQAYDQAFRLTTLRHWVHFLNCKYAKFLRTQNSGRRDWVRWQEGRLAGWKPRELTPRASGAPADAPRASGLQALGLPAKKVKKDVAQTGWRA